MRRAGLADLFAGFSEGKMARYRLLVETRDGLVLVDTGFGPTISRTPSSASVVR
ncbi:MAG: hypothetical protein U0165_02940 [Polyangiaceae bacterium]